MKCDEKTFICDDEDIKKVQWRSQCAGNKGTNIYEGEIKFLCSGCRKFHCGEFKIMKEEN